MIILWNLAKISKKIKKYFCFSYLGVKLHCKVHLEILKKDFFYCGVNFFWLVFQTPNEVEILSRREIYVEF